MMPKARLQFVFILCCLLAVFAVQVFAQDAPAEDVPEATAITEPTDIPTEVPTDIPTDIPTVEPPPEVTAEMTVEPPALETPPPPTPTLVEPALPAEPVLALLAREMFDSGDLSAWVLGGGWSLAANASGLGLQLIGAPDVLQFQRGPLYSAAAQADFMLTGGSVHLSLRQSMAGSYTAALDAAGLVTLYRAGVPVLSASVLVQPDQWYALRLSVMDGILRVAVNGVELLAWPDTAPLPPGFAGIAAFPSVEGAPFTAQVDNFFLWVPETDLALYPPPTPIPPTPESIQPTLPPVTEEPPVIITEEPTAVVTQEVTGEPAPEVTVEPTLEPTDIPTEEPVGPNGKSLVPQAYAPPPGIAPAAANQPGSATVINTIPYTDTDTTTGSDAAGEPAPSCAFNVLATVWYRFTPPAAGKYNFFTTNSSFDTVLAAYTSYSPAIEQACNDDVSAKDLSSRLTLTFTDQDVLAGKTIWIQLGGYNAAHGSYTFNAQLATVPAPRPPVLTAPANRLLTNIPAQAFTWTAPTSGEPPFRYQIQIDDDSKFGSPLHDEYISGLSYNATLLDGAYYWRARSLNVNNVGSAWTSARSLTVDTLPPDAPVLTTPADGSPVNTPRPKLAWKAPTGGKTYTVQLKDDTDTIILTANTTATSLSLSASLLPNPLQHGRLYTWQVRAADAVGNPGSFSPPSAFTVNLLKAPAHDAVIRSSAPARVAFSWVAAGFTGATYTLQVADNPAFSGAETFPGLTSTSFTLPTDKALTPGRYYWRLQVDGQPANTLTRAFAVTGALPGAPKLITPANNTLMTDDPVSLTWTLLDVTFTYHIQIATDSRFNNRVVDEDGLAGPDYAAAGLGDGLYFWRVRAINTDTAPGPWSAVWRFTVDRTAPDAPVLTTPADGSPVNTPRPKLAWKAPTGGKTYTVQLKDDTDTIILTANTTATSLSLSASLLPNPLQHGRLYTWQVRAADAVGNPGSFSPPSAFTVNLLKAPAHDAVIRSSAPARVAFSWVAAGFTGATYTLQVADNPAFSGAETFPGLTSTSFTLPTDKALTPGRYYWRLQVDGQPANTLTRAFAVTGALPGAPKLITPANNTFFQTAPELSWTTPTGTLDHYEIQVATDNRFANLVYSSQTVPAGTNVHTPTLPGDAKYFWRVRAVNTDTAPGGWSSVWAFTIDTVAPDAPPVLNTPANDSSTTQTQPRFTWRAVPGAVAYDIQMSSTGSFTTPTPYTSRVKTASFAPPGPLLYTTYHWRVRAVDAAGNESPWSEPFRVKIVSPTSAVPVLNRFTNGQPNWPLTWTPISWAIGYELQVADNSRFTSPRVYNLAAGVLSYNLLPEGLPNGTYYWRVRAKKDATAFGAWSSTGVFQIDASG